LVAGETVWLVHPSDPEALRAGLETLLSDASLCERLARNAAYQGADFDWNAIAQRHIGLYDVLLSHSRGEDGSR
jgi:glycosyltransferase involved in cell wall biosynthesis